MASISALNVVALRGGSLPSWLGILFFVSLGIGFISFGIKFISNLIKHFYDDNKNDFDK